MRGGFGGPTTGKYAENGSVALAGDRARRTVRALTAVSRECWQRRQHVAGRPTLDTLYGATLGDKQAIESDRCSKFTTYRCPHLVAVPCSSARQCPAPAHGEVFSRRSRSCTAGQSSPLDRSCPQQSTCGEACSSWYNMCIFGSSAYCPKPEHIIPSSHELSGVLRRARRPIATSDTASELWHPEDAGVYVLWFRCCL